ncbi:hypothetical protein [Flavobacterium reichenbachii]|uniref:hypothetical protein n=1 Tax=Flavobacterium reichenbachii TaxID=362418 RepID=UPI000F4DF673|nr:hypothetical protein [Flavobacterium reichenbachii]
MSEKQLKDYFIFTRSNYSIIDQVTVSDQGEEIKRESQSANNFQAYIFWKENSKCFIKLVNMNFEYQPVEIKDCEFLKLDTKTINKICKENVLPLIERDHGREVMVDIPNHYDIKFYFTEGSSKDFPDFYLDELSKKNVNYAKNSKLQIFKLYQACKKIIDENQNKINIKQ